MFILVKVVKIGMFVLVVCRGFCCMKACVLGDVLICIMRMAVGFVTGVMGFVRRVPANISVLLVKLDMHTVGTATVHVHLVLTHHNKQRDANPANPHAYNAQTPPYTANAASTTNTPTVANVPQPALQQPTPPAKSASPVNFLA